MIISNNLIGRMPVPDDAVIRLNLAWMPSRDEAEGTLADLRGRKVYLDYPQGRTKPPKPVVTLIEAIELANKYEVSYFAVSNIESYLPLLGIKSLLREGIALVPKIESEVGVKNMRQIVQRSGVKTAMLDAEDIYTNVGHDVKKYLELVQTARATATSLGITLLELRGVFFS